MQRTPCIAILIFLCAGELSDEEDDDVLGRDDTRSHSPPNLVFLLEIRKSVIACWQSAHASDPGYQTIFSLILSSLQFFFVYIAYVGQI